MSDTNSSTYSRFAALVQEMKRENAPVLASMVATFRANQAALKAQKIQFSKSGEINPNLLASYKTAEDIFLRHTTTTKGINHGFVLHLDWSASMRTTISAVLWQTLNLIWLAETLHTPIEVYVFSNEGMAWGGGGKTIQFYDSAAPAPVRLKSQTHILAQILAKGNLSAILNSGSMTDQAAVADRVYMHLPSAVDLKLRKVIHRFTYGEWLSILNVKFGLGGTPLYHAVISSVATVRSFRERHRVEKCLSVWLTDGSNAGTYSVCADGTTANPDEKFYSPLTGKTYGGPDVHESHGPFSFHRDATGAMVVILDISYSASNSFSRYATNDALKSIGIQPYVYGGYGRRRSRKANRPAKYNPKTQLKPADREAAFAEFGTASLTRSELDMGPDVVIATNQSMWSSEQSDVQRADSSIAGLSSRIGTDLSSPALTAAMVSLRATASMRRFSDLVVPFLAQGMKTH